MRIILIGFGVVGKSFVEIVLERREELVRKLGISPKIVAIADRGGAMINLKGIDLAKALCMKEEKGSVSFDPEFGHPKLSPLSVIEDVDADVVVEVTPTNVRDGEPGMSHIRTALMSKKHVVTTNKGPLALALPALLELAEYNNVYLRFSGTVGGGTPMLDLAKRCLQGDRILSIRGILNGTTNYILTRMEEDRIPFEEALREAQRLGYAEADPSMDVDGIDTACKLVIMANWIMNKRVTLPDVDIHGIRGITLKEVEEAMRRGFSMKLIGSIDDELKVEPMEIRKDDPLCVRGNLNAVTFVSQFAGEQTIIGRGAGGIETASAILRDLLEIKRVISERM